MTAVLRLVSLARLSPRAPSSVLFLAYLALLPVYCLALAGGATAMVWWLTLAIPIGLCAAMFAHALERRGLAAALALFGTGGAITLAAEALGAGTGIPFGAYAYADTLGPKAFGLVPWLIPIAWCGMLYPAWTLAGVVTARPLPRVIVAALAMTAWDLSLDPRMVSEGHWTWAGGGPYFGVPLSNFVGWAITAALVYAVWTWIERRRPPRPELPGLMPLPLTAYGMVWLGEAIANAIFWAGPLVGLCVFVGMGIFVGLAARRLAAHG